MKMHGAKASLERLDGATIYELWEFVCGRWWFARGRVATRSSLAHFKRTRSALAATSRGLHALFHGVALHELRVIGRAKTRTWTRCGPGWRQRMDTMIGGQEQWLAHGGLPAPYPPPVAEALSVPVYAVGDVSHDRNVPVYAVGVRPDANYPDGNYHTLVT